LSGLLLAVACIPSSVAALNSKPAFDACFERAGAIYNIPASLLRAIAMQESSMRPDATNHATFNGSVDSGVMQINSGWHPTLRRHGIDPASLSDPCTNITVGAWILAQEIRRHGFSWTAVGAYHSPTPERRTKYAAQVARHLERALSSPPAFATGETSVSITAPEQVGRSARDEMLAVERRTAAFSSSISPDPANAAVEPESGAN
jgi:hypothetical protein